MIKFAATACVFLLSACSNLLQKDYLPQNSCRALFNGHNLSGWEILGPARFSAANGELVGEAVLAQDSSFLRTNDSYSDFDLSMEFTIARGLNSGVQFRSNQYTTAVTRDWIYASGRVVKKTWPAGSVFGYQAEIDPRREVVGVVLDDAGRGFFDLLPAKANYVTETVLFPTEWNTLRIRANGESITTWVNGKIVTLVMDRAYQNGFIALQVHSVKDASNVGKNVRWRNLRICAIGP